MVKLLYRYNKNDFTRLYINKDHRDISQIVFRILMLFLLAILSLGTFIMYKFYLYDGKGEISYHDMYQTLAQAAFMVFMLSMVVVLPYLRAGRSWEMRRMIREKTCYIQTISFDIDCFIVDCVIFNKRMTKKIFYKDLTKAGIYKNGLCLSMKGKIPLYVYRTLFDTEQEYEKVCKWIKENKKSKGSKWKIKGSS